jgi:FkbM family methyltransferase
MPTVREFAVSAVNHVPGPLAPPFQSGGFLARSTAPLLELLLPAEITEVVVRSGPARGLRLLIDPRSEKYYWTGSHELRVARALEALLSRGDVVWEVGAHMGYFALLAARRVPDGLFHGFEPSPANRHRLLATMRLNGARNIRVHAFAVARTSASRRPYGYSSTASLVPPAGLWSNVECRTLDELLFELGARDLVEIDPEGAEIERLLGGRELLRDVQPFILIEIHNETIAPVAEDLIGYRLDRLSRRHWIAKPKGRG